MGRVVANLAVAFFFFVGALGALVVGYVQWVDTPDCLREPAACDTYAYLTAPFDFGWSIGFAVILFALGARVIWNMRHGDRS